MKKIRKKNDERKWYGRVRKKKEKRGAGKESKV